MNEDHAGVWRTFLEQTGRSGAPFDVLMFGDSPELADDLLALVLSGDKRATCTRVKAYEAINLAPPTPGDLSLVIDGSGEARGVIETVQVDVAPFNTATAEFAFEEGEGDKSLDWWREAHRAYFARECADEGTQFSEEEEVVFERFRLIWRTDT